MRVPSASCSSSGSWLSDDELITTPAACRTTLEAAAPGYRRPAVAKGSAPARAVSSARISRRKSRAASRAAKRWEQRPSSGPGPPAGPRESRPARAWPGSGPRGTQRQVQGRRRLLLSLEIRELDLALELAAQLRRRAPRASDPLADLRGHLRQALRAEHEQPDHEDEHELTEAEFEHAPLRALRAAASSSLGKFGVGLGVVELRLAWSGYVSGRFAEALRCSAETRGERLEPLRAEDQHEDQQAR